jgi:D-amino-acid dehydrogenase
MRVIVMGAGLAGVTSAWFLSKAGFHVEVIERLSEDHLDSKKINYVMMPQIYNYIWAKPSFSLQIFDWLKKYDSLVTFDFSSLDLNFWSWSFRFLSQCSPYHFEKNMIKLMQLVTYSRVSLQTLTEEIKLSSDHNNQGHLSIYNHHRAFLQDSEIAKKMERFEGIIEVKSVHQMKDLFPQITEKKKDIVGGLFTPHNECAHSSDFTKKLRDECKKRGVVFHYDSHIYHLEWQDNLIKGVVTNKGRFTAETYVIALGSWSPLLARQVGIRLPIYPIKQYSLSYPIKNQQVFPSIGITDQGDGIRYQSSGEKLYCQAGLEFRGWSEMEHPQIINRIKQKSVNFFPEICHSSEIEIATVLQPCTPDMSPLIGKSTVQNLFLNCGHGLLGWTLACGSAKLLSDVMNRRSPDLAIQDYEANRYFFMADFLLRKGAYDG